MPVTLVNNLAIVSVPINDSGPLAFIVDTGAAATVIDGDTARTLGLASGKPGEATTGGGAVATEDLGPVSLTIGDGRLTNLKAIAIDLTGLRVGLGRRVDGILGYELFDRFVVEFDHAGRNIRLHDPATYAPPDAAVVVPLRFEERIPLADVRVRADDGRWLDAKVEFDTGQSGALTLHRPYVERERAFDRSHPAVNIVTGAILAGGVSAQVTRLGALEIAGVELESPVVTVTLTAEAAGVSERVAGILGAEVLRRFRVTVDYGRSRAVLEQTAAVPEPFTFDAAGLSLGAARLDPPEYRVRSLIEGSPAREAGIEAGDVLTAIDGEPAEMMTLTQIRERLREPNRTLRLTFLRKGEPQTVTIVTRRLV